MAGMDKSLTAALWTAGMSLGTGLQMINDTYDLSPKNPNRFADLRAGKVTLPYYLESQATGTAEEKVATMKKEMREKILVCHKDGVTALKCLPNNEGKQLIIQAFDILVISKLIA
jgi:geranylgeranyl pyrophosphate synthase